jgi:hypothetical protein
MIPKSLSASAVQVAESCMSRYHAENILRAERPPNRAASLGTVVHTALEWYVRAVYIDKTKPPSLDTLLNLFKMHFAVEFETFDTDSEEYKDGVDMLQRWYGRTTRTLEEREVISCEVKTNFNIPTSAGDIPFNYIWDRFDKLPGDEEYEVVDYKSVRFAFGPEELKNKIQARCYSLAARIQRPTAKRIWVRFDLLRHDSVAVVFTRDQDIATWEYLKSTAERIIATSDTELTETLNAECKWCVRKVACATLQSHIGGGGVLGVGTELFDQRAEVDYKLKALAQLARELDEIILRQAEDEDTTEFETPNNRITIGWSQRRTVDPERVLLVVGPELFNKYDGPLMNYTTFNRLLKDRAVTADMKERLKGLVYSRRGEPTVRVAPRNPIDGD